MYVDAWMNINPKGAGNEKHTHPSCAFAGVIWLKIPENSGNLFFYSPFGHIGIDEIMAYDQDFANSFHMLFRWFLHARHMLVGSCWLLDA